MGTAPTQQQHPALPDPVQLVEHAATLLVQLGMTRDEALAKVMHVAANVLVTLRVDGFTDTAWLGEVIQAAKAARPVPAPSDTEWIGQDNADGNGGRSGSPA